MSLAECGFDQGGPSSPTASLLHGQAYLLVHACCLHVQAWTGCEVAGLMLGWTPPLVAVLIIGGAGPVSAMSGPDLQRTTHRAALASAGCDCMYGCDFGFTPHIA